jgi:glutamyl-Q tRNA(Asp) synthetase
MDDLDPPREVPGAAAEILNALERLGLAWDGPVLYQSTRAPAYAAAVDQLAAAGRIYPCACPRRLTAGGRYPGTCRDASPLPTPRSGPLAPAAPLALRVRTQPGEGIAFTDRLLGEQRQDLHAEGGDFVVRRADQLYAYHLAVVVDDAAQGITEVARGADLLDSTARQIHLQHLLGLPTPAYAHLPLALGADGQKLSKQNLAPPLPLDRPGTLLCRALAALGQDPPPGLAAATPAEILAHAGAHWDLQRVPRAPLRAEGPA